MGESKRMISSLIYEYPKFTKMKAMSKLLYTYMNLYTDEYGVCVDFEKARLMSGATRKDLDNLLTNGYVMELDTDIYLIKHFPMFNSFRKDRLKPCRFSKALSRVRVNENKVYTWADNDRQMPTIARQMSVNDGQMTAQDKISKDNIREDNLREINTKEELRFYLHG